MLLAVLAACYYFYPGQLLWVLTAFAASVFISALTASYASCAVWTTFVLKILTLKSGCRDHLLEIQIVDCFKNLVTKFTDVINDMIKS